MPKPTSPSAWCSASPRTAGSERLSIKATGQEAREAEVVGKPIVSDAEVSFGAEPNVVMSGPYTFFAGTRSDPFFVDFAGVLTAFDWQRGKNFTVLKDVDPSPWTGNDTLAPYNAFGIVLELPTSELGANPTLGIWGRVSVRRNGKLDHVDRAGHPTIASFFNTDETKEEYNRTEPAQDRERFLHQAIEILEHNGGYSPEEAEAVIDEAGLLPDMLRYDPGKAAEYPNGRALTDHVVAARLALISNNRHPERRARAPRRPARGVSLPRRTRTRILRHRRRHQRVSPTMGPVGFEPTTDGRVPEADRADHPTSPPWP